MMLVVKHYTPETNQILLPNIYNTLKAQSLTFCFGMQLVAPCELLCDSQAVQCSSSLICSGRATIGLTKVSFASGLGTTEEV